MVESAIYYFFFFQAEDGIRDHCVTGVQTCALPISSCWDALGDVLTGTDPRPWFRRPAKPGRCHPSAPFSRGQACKLSAGYARRERRIVVKRPAHLMFSVAEALLHA